MNPLRTLRTLAIRALGVREARSMGVGGGAFLPAPVMSGIAVTPETALTFTAVFSAHNVLSTDVASLPLEVCRKLPGQGRRAVLNDPRYNLVYCEPNEDTTSIRFRTSLMHHILGWGNAYAQIDRLKSDGTPAALLWQSPRPNDTKPVKAKSGRLYYLTDGGRGKTIPAENMIHVAGMGWDGLTGYSPIAMARQAVGLGIAAEQFGASLFGNGSMPKGVLKKPGKFVTKEAFERFRDQWERVHQGTMNANRVAILEEGMEWQNITIAPEDAQFLATRQFQVLEIARIYNLPPNKIGDYSQSHRSNVEEANLDYLNTTLRPWLEAFEQEINRKFFSRLERRRGLCVSHDMSALLRGNTKERTERNTAMRNGGAITSNEWRMDEGFNPLPAEYKGDMPVMQAQYVPIESLGQSSPAALAQSPGGSNPSEKQG